MTIQHTSKEFYKFLFPNPLLSIQRYRTSQALHQTTIKSRCYPLLLSFLVESPLLRSVPLFVPPPSRAPLLVPTLVYLVT